MSYYIEPVVSHEPFSISDFKWCISPKQHCLESTEIPAKTFPQEDAPSVSSDTSELPVVAQPAPEPESMSPPIEWRSTELPKIPPKGKGGRPKGSKNKTPEERIQHVFYDPKKRADEEGKFDVYLRTKAFKCRQGDHGARETLAVIIGSFHRFCGITKVHPTVFVEILTKWGRTLPEPWLVEKNCGAADSWWRKLAIASLDIYATIIKGAYRDGRRLGGCAQSRMYRLLSVFELWHYLHFRDSASSYWRSYVIERECQKSSVELAPFEACRRELAMNSSRPGSFLRSMLSLHFSKLFEEISAIQNRRNKIECRIADLEKHTPANPVCACVAPVPPGVDHDLIGSVLSSTADTPGNLNIDIIIPCGGYADISNNVDRMKVANEHDRRITGQATEMSGGGVIPSMTTSAQTMPTSADVSLNHHPYLEDVCGIILHEIITEEVRRSDGSLNLAHPEVYSYVLNSPFLSIRDYPISFLGPATWNEKSLEVRPAASAQLQYISKTASRLCKEVAQKEKPHSICAGSMSMAIEIIKNDESLKNQTEELRKQIKLERAHFEGNRESNAEQWRRQILTGWVSSGKRIDEERRGYRKLAEQLPYNIKRRLPSIVPSGWVFVRNYFDGCHFRENARTVLNDAIIPNGLLCVDFDKLGDQLSMARQRLIESGLCSLVAISASGNGLYAMVRYDKIYYREIAGFHAAREAIWNAVKRMGLEPDGTCKDISRRRFLAHDPELWIDESDTARLTH